MPISKSRTSATWLAQLASTSRTSPGVMRARRNPWSAESGFRTATLGLAGLGTQGEEDRLEQPLLGQSAADQVGDRVDRRVGLIAGAEGPQRIGKGVVPVDPGDLLDEVDLLPQVGPPPRYFHRQPLLGRLVHQRCADGHETLLQHVDRQLDAEHLGHPRGAKEDPGGSARLGPAVHAGAIEPAARGRQQHLDAAAQRVRHRLQIGAPLEPQARLGGEAERLASGPGGRGSEPGALEEEIGRAGGDLGALAAHHTGDSQRAPPHRR